MTQDLMDYLYGRLSSEYQSINVSLQSQPVSQSDRLSTCLSKDEVTRMMLLDWYQGRTGFNLNDTSHMAADGESVPPTLAKCRHFRKINVTDCHWNCVLF